MLLPLPFPIRFAVQVDLLLNALAAVIGPQHIMLCQRPIEQFGVLVAVGVVVHELSPPLRDAARWLRRWWKRRP